MAVIIKNTTGSEIVIAGIGIPASDEITMQESDRVFFATSDTLVTKVGSGDIVINDGTLDLSASDGLDLVKGFYPKRLRLVSPIGGDIGADGDYLKIRQPVDVAKSVIDKSAFTITTGLVTVSSQNETPLILLKNPSDSGKRILITHFKFGTDSANVRSMFKVYYGPTITTDGTVLDIENTYIESSPVASDMDAYSFPTISANGSVLNLDIAPSNSPSKGVNRTYVVEAGQNILVTVENSASNAKTFGDIYWLEGV